MTTTSDVIVVGAGMAGASVAYELAASCRVAVLEAEAQPGYHATGRSAAAYIPSYGCELPALRELTLASRRFLEVPPTDFHSGRLLARRGLLTLATAGGRDGLNDLFQQQQAAVGGVEWVEEDFLQTALPLLREDYLGGAIYEREVFDIDVHGLHQAYLAGCKQRGGEIHNAAPVQKITRDSTGWQVETDSSHYSAPVLVNAAGAWADATAELAGVAPLGIQALRRTAILIETPTGPEGWPLAFEAEAGFYFKPDSGLLLVSPGDETPSPACDAAAEEIDIAWAAHYASQALDLEVRRVKHHWAGLRCFAADRSPVIGFDPRAEGFFWLAGQGGHGIQIAPAAAMLAAAQISGLPAAETLQAAEFNPDWVAPARLFESRQ